MEGFLTDSAISSSSIYLGFLEFLCCFLLLWLLRAEAATELEWLPDRLELDSKLGDAI
jgi:hypothetical protein